jgi:tape measure domain-containing protein
MAGPINAASLKIFLDTKQLQESGKFASNELRSLSRIMAESETPADKFQKKIDLLGRAVHQGGLDMDEYGRRVESLAAKYGVVTPAMQRAADAANALKQQEKALADQMAYEAQILKQREALMQRGRQLIDQTRTAQEQHSARMAEYNQLLRMGAINQETHDRAVRQSASSLQSATQQGTAFQRMLESGVTQVASMVAGYASLNAVVNLLTGSIKKYAEFQSSQVQFAVLTGSSTVSKSLMAEFKMMDQMSPLAMASFEKAGKTLLGYGMSAKQLVPTLKQLSEVSMGNDDRFQSLALAMGQVTANGRLMGQEVLQMVNAGFNPLQQISEDTGISMTELRKRMEEGSISSQMVTEAFKRATSEGGRFYQMNELMAKTLQGTFAKTVGAIGEFQRALGSAFSGSVKSDLSNVNSLLGTLSKGLSNITSLMDDVKKAERSIVGDRFSNLLTTLSNFTPVQIMRLGDAERDIAATIENEVKTRETMSAQLDKQLETQIKLSQQYAQQGEDLAYQLDQLILGNREAERLKSMREGTDFNQAQSVNDQKAQLDFLKEKQRLQDEFRVLAGGDLNILQNERDIRNGMSEQQAEELYLLRIKIDLERKSQEELKNAEKERIAEERKAAEDAQRAFKDQQREADQLFNRFNPQDRMRSEMEKLFNLRQGGFIDDTLMNQAGVSLAAGFVQNASGGLASTIAPALKAGSVEAYKFIAQQNEKSKQAAEAKKLAEDQLKELRKIAEQNTNAPRLAMAGRN